MDELPEAIGKKFTTYLTNLHNTVEGGFRGWIGMDSHMASTYAAMLAIANIGTEDAYKIIDKDLMLKYLKSMCSHSSESTDEPKKSSKVYANEDGGYLMHINGENDLRAWYWALVVADILGLLPNEELTAGLGDFIQKCQTYEGGIACNPYGEAHAGYTFCGLAAMIILGETDKLNMDALIDWTVNRQLEVEGGYNGRINKLVDSWYNFWLGATVEMIDIVLKGKSSLDNGEWVCNQLALQGYTVICCKSSAGGLKDKPGKHVDLYHTMYSLAGNSIAQHKR